MRRMEAREGGKETKRVTGQIIKILGHPTTTVDPGAGAMDSPSFVQGNDLSLLT
jgi:hypothetical protein